MSTTPDNSDDVIDSRDVIARIEELTAELEELGTVTEQITSPYTADEIAQMREERRQLIALADEGENCHDWQHGEMLIRDSYFQTYAQELADDIGAIDANATWPCNCIDWEKAARELRMDYTSMEFDGVTYWGRS